VKNKKKQKSYCLWRNCCCCAVTNEHSADRAYISTTFRALKEIEEGIKHEFIETIQDHAETERLVPKVIRSATEEILLILSTNIL